MQKHLEPQVILDYLNENVIGQNMVKESLSIAIANHINMLTRKNIKIPKPNTIIIGETGTGKTFLMQELGKFVKKNFGIHLSISDATKITEDGYSGLSASDIVAQLLEKTGDVDVAKSSIIYIDEIDKLLYDPNNDRGRIGVFNSLLKIIEGTTIQLSDSIDTTNILFIVGGVFEGLTKKPKNTIGFCKDIDEYENAEVIKTEKNHKRIDAKDLIDFGLPAEFVGRFNIITKLDDMSEETLRQILLKKIVPNYKDMFALYNKYLNLSEDEIEKIINNACLSKSGARGLNNFIADKFRDAIFNQKKVKKEGLCN